MGTYLSRRRGPIDSYMVLAHGLCEVALGPLHRSGEFGVRNTFTSRALSSIRFGSGQPMPAAWAWARDSPTVVLLTPVL